MRKAEDKNIIEIKEETQIGDVILEKGDKIEVLPKESIKESVESDIINSDINLTMAYYMIENETFDEYVESYFFGDVEEAVGAMGEEKAREIFDWIKANIYIVGTRRTRIVDATEVPISYKYVGFGASEGEGEEYIVFSTVPGVSDILKIG